MNTIRDLWEDYKDRFTKANPEVKEGTIGLLVIQSAYFSGSAETIALIMDIARKHGPEAMMHLINGMLEDHDNFISQLPEDWK
jgi:hypothetical protein